MQCVDGTCNVEHCGNGYVHDEEGNNRCKSCNFLFLLGHTDCDAHRKDDRQIGKYDIAGFAHDIEQCVENSTRTHDTKKVIGFQHCCIGEGTTNSKKQTCDWQDGDRKHEAAADSL